MSSSATRRISRRNFLQWIGAAGLGAAAEAAGAFGLAKLLGSSSVAPPVTPQPWELAQGVVDYGKLAESEGPPDALGVPQTYLDHPAKRILHVAQWYDYWPSRVILDFSTYMGAVYGLGGVQVEWASNVYTSNETLLGWILGAGKDLDVVFPTDYAVETLEKAGQIVNMNKDWLPNYVNILGKVPSQWPDRFQPHREDFRYVQDYPTWANGYNNEAGVDFRTPALNGYAYRMNSDIYPNPRGADLLSWNEDNSLLAVPYQWGTTGIAYRTSVIDPADLQAMGWEVFEKASYTNWSAGKTYDLRRKMMLLDDAREGIGAGLKATGWTRQLAAGLNPTAIPHASGEYQWSNNETADEYFRASSDWIRSIRGNLWGFNTPQQGPWIVSGTMFVDQAWSGDIMYAIRPNSNQFLPIDYVVPKQGSTWWIDNGVIPRSSEKVWLAHAFLNYLQDPRVQALTSAWNLYATPNAWAFAITQNDPAYTFSGRYPDGSPYLWNPAADPRIYADIATGYAGDPILERCEMMHDLGAANARLQWYWTQAKA